jgi:hypothetical protein
LLIEERMEAAVDAFRKNQVGHVLGKLQLDVNARRGRRSHLAPHPTSD